METSGDAIFGEDARTSGTRYNREIEPIVAEVWAEVLGLARVDPERDFLELGGHSLLATQIVSRLRDRTGIELSLSEFFAAPTMAGNIELLRRRTEATGGPFGAEIPIVARDGSFPLSPAQARMWFINELSPGNRAYFVEVHYEVLGPFDEDLFNRAVEVVVGRHEAFRTIFERSDRGPVQRIIPNHTTEIPLVDLTRFDEAGSQAEVQRLIAADLAEPFDFAAPAWRLIIVRLAPERHLILTAMHHVIFDQWSGGLFMTELSTVYTALSAGREVDLPPMGPQYIDFALWQQTFMRAGGLDHELDYWRTQLAGLPTVSFPTDRIRPPVQGHAGSMVRSELGDDLIARIRKWCVELQVTPFMFLTATFALLVNKYTGEKDLPFGVPVANRHRLAVEKIMGTFVNTLVLRCDLDGDPTFTDLAERVRRTSLDAYAHQELPFERLVEELVHERDLSRQPLFQTMINVVNMPFDLDRLDGAEVREFVCDHGSSQVDLTLNAVFDEYDGFEASVKFEYSTDLFDESTMQALLDRYLRLLSEVTADPARRLSDYSIMSEADELELEQRWNRTEQRYRTGIGVHKLVSVQAHVDPEREAVAFGDAAIDYRELDNRSNRLARHLQARGAGPGRFVGLYLHRSIDMVVGLLGILKSGAAYLPLDPSFPVDRLADMVDDSDTTLLISQQALREELPGGEDVDVVWIDDDWDLIAGQSDEPLDAMIEPGDLMYVIYTSGSTGRPKGVAIEHRSVVNFLMSMAKTPGLTPDDALLSVTTLSFDISVLEIFLPLMIGAKVVIASRTEAADGSAIAELMDHHDITVMQATPATWSMLIESGWTGSDRLRKVLCGGEALPRELANRILERAPELWNMYGPTETTIWSAVERIERGDEPITIGSPIANTSFHVVDELGRRVPIGVPGELLIGGHGLARGYLNRPELTADRFIPDTIGREHTGVHGAARLYRTGDLARFRRDGKVEFMGRLDSQVKIRGFRVELGEIEHSMGSHPSLRQAIVIAKPSPTGDSRLVGYYLLRQGAEDPSFDEWRSHLRVNLPDYMIPSAFVALDEFPLTPNNKVDRKALPEPSADHGATGEYIPAERPVQHQLVATWERVLGRERIGIRDDFFAIGGQSLLAVRMFAALRTEFGVELELRSIFDHSTIERLAPLVERALGQEQDPVGDDPAFDHLVELSAGQPGVAPFYCVHGAGGEVLFMHPWLEHMGPVPLVGVQAVGFDGRREPHASIGEMADAYAAEIIRYQPAGPIFLGGYSGGGLVALEMARCLRQLGRDVAMVVLIDTYNPAVDPKRMTAPDRLNGWIDNPGARLRKAYRNRVAWNITKLRNRSRSGRFDAVPADLREYFVFEHMEKLVLGHRPEPYDGLVLLLRSATDWFEADGSGDRRGWKGTLHNLVVQEIPGDHRSSITEQHAPATVEKLVDALVHAGCAN